MINYLRKIINIDRNPVLDLCRSLAILYVVIFHFMMNFPNAPFQFIYNQGHLGVDLFFIISGYLVGRQPLKLVLNNKKQNFKEFYIKRFFKIIPSFWFLILGAYLLYNVFFPFPLKTFEAGEWFYYFTFTQNYSGSNVLSHAWSLCVEEHFYIILPISLLILRLLKKSNPKQIFVFLILAIISAYLFRYIGYIIHYETYAATHNRIDALALGVLLALLELTKNNFFNLSDQLGSKQKARITLGIVILGIGLFIGGYSKAIDSIDNFYYQVLYHGFVPLGIFLILSQTLNLKFKLPIWLKLSAYFSYNWYLWHCVIVFYLVYYFEDYKVIFLPYILVTFVVSVLTTYFIEEPFMRLRNQVLIKFTKR